MNHVGYPAITVTPTNQSVEVTFAATFTATVAGVGPFTYQWWKGNGILMNETGSTYTVYNVSTEVQSYYRCHVFNTFGDSAVSDRVWLQVISTYMYRIVSFKNKNLIMFNSVGNLPSITENPTDKFVGLESNFTNASLTCKADEASSYRWEKQNDFIPSSAIGVYTNTLTFINLQLRDAGRYRCIATNDSGSTESDFATLTIKGN